MSTTEQTAPTTAAFDVSKASSYLQGTTPLMNHLTQTIKELEKNPTNEHLKARLKMFEASLVERIKRG